MDFKLSYYWLKEFVDVRISPEELAERLSLHSVSVERIRRLDEGLDPKVVVGRVERIEAHPNADKLRVAYVTTHPPTPPLPEGRGERKRNFSPSHRDGSPPARGGARGGGSGEREGVGQLAKVVCGGINLREGMLVAFAPPGAKVRWHGEGELVELKSTEIRGVRSDGMICAASEIGLGEYFPQGGEREILDLEAASCKLQAASSIIGRPLAEALGLDDTILDCEITTNRPDLMSVVGLAREVAAITGSELRELGSYELRATSYKLPHPHVLHLPVGGGARGGGKGLQLEAVGLQLRIEDRSACPRYGAVIIDGVKVAPSPWLIQRRLLAAGLRPINNVVDATNYILLERGQPLHAFDAAKLTRAARHPEQSEGSHTSRESEIATRPSVARKDIEVVVRRARAGESLRALDGNTYQLRPEDLVIANTEKAIALAGVIGGEETAVTDDTTRIILECANFDPLSVRRTSRALGIRTESSLRFDKGLPPESADHTIVRTVELLCELVGGRAGHPIIVGKKFSPLPRIRFETKIAAARIGTAITSAVMQQSLVALGCKIQKKTPGVFSVTPPWWRRGDLEESHDLTEEIARLYGYHRLPATLPSGVLPAAVRVPEPPTTAFGWEDRVRGILIGVGYIEVMPFSLTSQEVIGRCGFAADQCIVLENPLSEEFALLRPSLVTTLLPLIAQNQEYTPEGEVFEFGNVYIPSHLASSRAKSRDLDRDFSARLRLGRNDANLGLPREEMRLCVVVYGRADSGGQVMRLKGIIEHLFNRLGIRDVEFRRSEQCELPSGLCLWHPGRTTDVVIGDTLVGVLGELHPTVVGSFGINQRVAVAELDWAPILAACDAPHAAAAPPIFPPMKRDLAFIVDRRTAYAEIASVLDVFDPLLTGFELFDAFEGGDISIGKKSLAFHLTFSAADRTLTTPEIDTLLARLIQQLRERFGAVARE